MNLATALSKLEAMGNEKVRARNVKRGAGSMPQFGVQLGHVRKLAKEIGADHELALELWGTGNIDARQLAVLLMDPKQFTREGLDVLVRDPGFVNVFDWLDSYIVRKHPEKEALRQAWLEDPNPWAARAGWSLTAERIGKQPEGLDLPGLLDRIEREMASSPAETQWTMNNCLAGIGIHHPEHRVRAIRIGEELGVYRDYPTPKGCTSPFAPIWITEMVSRQEAS
ncbi:MAG: DNA alkylation repair protein [Trueperaceae bacterium]